VDFRVLDSISTAEKLNASGYHRHAIVSAVTAIELIIRFMLIRPLIQAAFLSEEWADLLTHRIAAGRTDEDRKILPHVLEFHGIKLKDLKLSDGTLLWDTITKAMYPKRHRIVHTGESAVAKDAKIAIECAKMLREKVVLPVAEKMGFTLDKTKSWNEIVSERWKTKYDKRDPFA